MFYFIFSKIVLKILNGVLPALEEQLLQMAICVQNFHAQMTAIAEMEEPAMEDNVNVL